jgi:hypothetical protein
VAAEKIRILSSRQGRESLWRSAIVAPKKWPPVAHTDAARPPRERSAARSRQPTHAGTMRTALRAVITVRERRSCTSKAGSPVVPDVVHTM